METNIKMNNLVEE